MCHYCLVLFLLIAVHNIPEYNNDNGTNEWTTTSTGKSNSHDDEDDVSSEEDDLTQGEVYARHNRYSRSRSTSRSSSAARPRRPKRRNRDPQLDYSDPESSDRSPKRRKKQRTARGPPPANPTQNPPNQQPAGATIMENEEGTIQPASLPARNSATYVNELEGQIDELKGELDGHTSIMEEVINFCEKTLGIKLKRHPRMNPITIKQIYELFRQIGWNNFKFFVNEHDRREGLTFLMDRSNWSFARDTPDNAEEREEFLDIYQSALGYICNYCRSYVMTQVTKEVEKLMDENNNKLPRSALAYSILQRNIDCSSEINKQFIVWWCDKFLPKVTCGVFNYAPEKRYYAPISECKIRYLFNACDELPSSTEAFAVSLFENTRSRWLNKRKLLHQLPRNKKKILIKERRNPEKRVVIAADTQVYYVTDHPKLGTKWSLPSSGQNKAGGWSQAGLEKFATLRVANEKARASADGKAKEQEILGVLRAAKNITENNAEAQAIKDGKITANKGRGARERQSIAGISGHVDLNREVTLDIPDDEED